MNWKSPKHKNRIFILLQAKMWYVNKSDCACVSFSKFYKIHRHQVIVQSKLISVASFTSIPVASIHSRAKCTSGEVVDYFNPILPPSQLFS